MAKLRISRQRKTPIDGPLTTSYAHNMGNRNPELNNSSFGLAIGMKKHPDDKMTFHTMTLTRAEVERTVLHMVEFLVDPHNTTRRHADELLELAKGYLATSNEMNVVQAYARPRRDAKGRLKVA